MSQYMLHKRRLRKQWRMFMMHDDCINDQWPGKPKRLPGCFLPSAIAMCSEPSFTNLRRSI